MPILDDNGQLIKYKKDKIVTKTEPDPERFEAVKKMWHMLIYENYTPNQICRMANKKWNFKARPIKERGKDEKII